MPRPTPAQFAYGALTTVSATLALLLTTQARSGAGVAAAAVAALALGILVSLAVARPSAAYGEKPSPEDASTTQSSGADHRSYRTPVSLRR